MNEKQREVILRALGLSATVREGLEHMELKLAGGDLENACHMLADVYEAVLSIENALKPLEGDAGGLLKANFAYLLEVLERKDTDQARIFLAESLTPAFERFHDDLRRRFEKYILS